ncbi:MAG: DUF4926 domain-containing protein [Chloroflexaceae bacterium]|nr:DUF4926 domain-containing protein [Chloroflexaceae bacterium]
MIESIQLLDVVILRRAYPAYELAPGQIGTVVEVLAADVFEVECSDTNGQTLVNLALPGDALQVLTHATANV